MKGIYTMKEKLLELKKKKKNVSVYCSEDSDKFLYGKILEVNAVEFALLMFTPYGAYDGIIVKSIDEITHIEYDGQYDKKMQKILSKDIETESYSINDSFITNSILELSIKQKKIVSIELLNSGYDNVVGFVEELLENKCTIRLVDEYGYEDGFSCFCVDDISQVVFDSEKESTILKLWQINKSLSTN